MKRIIFCLSVTALIFSFQEVSSQSLRSMVKKRLGKENIEIKSKKDSMTVIEVDDASESSSAHFTDEAVMSAFGLTDNVPYETDYNFDAYIQMEISNYKKNGKLDDQVVYDNYMHKKDADYAMVFKDGNDKSTMIYDTGNKAMLIMTDSDGEKSGFATTIDPEAMAQRSEAYADKSEAVPPNFTKTGNTKKILGYSCDEYLVEDEESEVHMWVSEKLGKEMQKEWLNNQQTFGAMFSQAYAINGMVMEYDVLDKDDGGKSVMQITKIDLNHDHSVSTEGYAIMSMRKKTEEEKKK